MRGMATIRTVAVSAVLVLGLLPTPAGAQTGTTFSVTRTDDPVPGTCDPGDCSLREAVLAANAEVGTPTILLSSATYELTIVGPESPMTRDLDVTSDMVVVGTGPSSTVIDANGATTAARIFDISGTSTLTATGLTLGGGRESGAAAVNVNFGSAFLLSDAVVTDNESPSLAGAINAQGSTTLTLTDVLVSGNQAGGVGGAIISTGTTTMTNVTITGNRTTSFAGGLLVNSGTATLNNVTITDNAADTNNSGGETGGGIDHAGGTVIIKNSIVAGNRVGTGSTGPDCSGTITSQGHNVLGDPSGCSWTAGPGDAIGANPQLGPLADNGGLSRTHALNAGSPALDRGQGCAGTDQRGAPRTGACDSGAYELVLCQGIVVNEVGTEAGDVITAGNGNDGVLALGGNDRVNALGGNDGVCAGSGNDRVSGGGGKDRLSGEGGKDRLRGQGGSDRLKGGPGKDTCVGGGGKDRAACETEKQIP
jgi:large repetitive protein